MLRVSGDILHTTLTDRHDALQRAMLSHVLGGDLPDVSVRQAQGGVRHGGVGLRSATEQALLAFFFFQTDELRGINTSNESTAKRCKKELPRTVGLMRTC